MAKQNQQKQIRKYIGLMSGTSMDGVDIALLETNGDEMIRTLKSDSIPYDNSFKSELQAVLCQSKRADKDVKAVEAKLTELHIEAVQNFLSQHNLSAEDIKAIGFHGHTLFHDPHEKVTLQIGDAHKLSKAVGIDVVYDMRKNDIKNGGQGAPLAPIYHHALARGAKLQLPVVFLNIGGVANITYVTLDPKDMIAFDTGPGNALIDDAMCRDDDNDLDYDDKGQIAAKGTINQQILGELLKLDYFYQTPPKSLDRNHFQKLVAPMAGASLSVQVATLTGLTVGSIVRGLDHLPQKPTQIIVCGGGRHNTTMMRWLEKMSGMTVTMADELKINGDSIEAELMAYLAARHLLDLPYSFPSTTGITEPSSGGALALARG